MRITNCNVGPLIFVYRNGCIFSARMSFQRDEQRSPSVPKWFSRSTTQRHQSDVALLQHQKPPLAYSNDEMSSNAPKLWLDYLCSSLPLKATSAEIVTLFADQEPGF